MVVDYLCVIQLQGTLRYLRLLGLFVSVVIMGLKVHAKKHGQILVLTYSAYLGKHTSYIVNSFRIHTSYTISHEFR
jgi:hypothetical protein